MWHWFRLGTGRMSQKNYSYICTGMWLSCDLVRQLDSCTAVLTSDKKELPGSAEIYWKTWHDALPKSKKLLAPLVPPELVCDCELCLPQVYSYVYMYKCNRAWFSRVAIKILFNPGVHRYDSLAATIEINMLSRECRKNGDELHQ